MFVPPAEPARAAFTPKADANYTLVARKANKCLQFTGANENDNAHAEIWTCNGSPAQSFMLQPVAGGYFTLVNVRSKKCLDIAGLATNDGAGAQQYSCNGGQNQQSDRRRRQHGRYAARRAPQRQGPGRRERGSRRRNARQPVGLEG